MQHFVMGFCFSHDRKEVALILKKRPAHQKGNWNGIGGHIESKDATKYNAMSREFEEETGHKTSPLEWEHTLTFTCPGGTIFVFRHFADMINLETKTDETVKGFKINTLPFKIMDNLLWIIPLQLGDIEFPVMLSQHELSIGGEK